MLFEVVELARAFAHYGVLAACRARIGAGIPGSDALPSPRPGRHSTPHARTDQRPDPITTVRLLHSILERLLEIDFRFERGRWVGRRLQPLRSGHGSCEVSDACRAGGSIHP